jgi:hypothetical protein
MCDFEPTKMFTILSTKQFLTQLTLFSIKQTVHLSECRLKYELIQLLGSSVLGVKISRLSTLGEK